MDITKSDLLTTTSKTRESRTLAASINTDSIADKAITSAKIKNLTWDKGQGGTLVLGGSANGNGVLSLKDSSGTEQVHINNTGIQVNNGKITINNNSNSLSYDGSGLRSTTNFSLTGVAANSLNQHGFADNTDTDITGATLTFTISRSINVLFLAACTCYLSETAGNTGNAYITFYLDGSEVSLVNRIQWFNDALSTVTNGVTGSNHFLKIPLAAGTHTIKLMAHLNYLSGTPDFFVYAFNLSYTQLGT